MIEYLLVASTFCLGLFAGGMVTEAVLLAPYFRTLNHDEFYRLHHAFGPRLYRFYAPLTICATVLPLLVATFAQMSDHPDKFMLSISALISLVILAIYFAYFQKANQGFADKAFDAPALQRELGVWSAVHSARTILALANFGVVLLAK